MCSHIGSIKANLDELILVLQNYLHYKQIDMLILTETWHSMDDCDLWYLNSLFFLFTLRNPKVLCAS